jgi:hypothetical protein
MAERLFYGCASARLDFTPEDRHFIMGNHYIDDYPNCWIVHIRFPLVDTLHDACLANVACTSAATVPSRQAIFIAPPPAKAKCPIAVIAALWGGQDGVATLSLAGRTRLC